MAFPRSPKISSEVARRLFVSEMLLEIFGAKGGETGGSGKVSLQADLLLRSCQRSERPSESSMLSDSGLDQPATEC